MDMKLLKDLEHRGCKELDKLFEKKEWGPAEFSIFHQLTGAVKNLKKIEESDTGGGYAMNGMNGYAQAGRWVANGTMEGEYGHAGRHRDSMGRYAKEGGYANSGDYSNHGSLMDMLGEKMRHARSDREREDIRRCMETVRTM